jgi:hypothetical protein
MKKFILIFILSMFLSSVSAQSYTYGNEWINYGQQYYKIKLFKEGIYKVDSSALASSGINLNSIDARNFQVFIKGQEQFIHIADLNNNNQINSNDFIEFYGKQNDCSYDSSMYYDISFVPNPHYSIVQDTAVAFLTWNSSVNNKRYSVLTDTTFSNYSPAPYFISQSVYTKKTNYFNGRYNFVSQSDPRFTSCEGWADNGPSLGTNKSYKVPTPFAVASGGTSFITASYMSSSANYQLQTYSLGDHHLRITWKDNNNNFNIFGDTLFWGFQAFKNTTSASTSLLRDTTEFILSSIVEPGYAANSSALNYISVQYPRSFNFSGSTSFTLFMPDATFPISKVFASFTNFNHANQSVVKAFDLTNGNLVFPVMNGSSGKFLINNGGGIKKVLLTSSDNDIVVTSLSKVNGTGSFVNYLNQGNKDSAFVIVTHSKFWNEANTYKSYRESAIGGNYQTVIGEINDLYDQFAYGNVKHPKSIRNFVKFLMDTFSTKPSYLFLIGKPGYGINGFWNPAAYAAELVPSWGYPPSDNLLLAGLDGTFLEPAIPTGRIAVTKPQEILDYLEKVQQHDSASINQWQKNVAHFVGGLYQNEIDLFTYYMTNYKNIIQGQLFGANVNTFTKNTSSPIQTSVPDSVISLINSGVSLMTFYGHSSNQSFDFDLNDPTEFNNKGKYPVLLSNSCYTGDIYQVDTASLSERYVLTKDKGAIAFIGSTKTGIAQLLAIYSEGFYQQLTAGSYGKGIGDISKAAIAATQYVTQYPDFVEQITCMEMTLHGDPAVRINRFTKPDYAIKNENLTCNTQIYPDSIQVNLDIYNLARAIDDSFRVVVTRVFPDGTSEIFIDTVKAPYFNTKLSYFIPVNNEKGAGLNYFRAVIDDINAIDEEDNTINNKTGNIPVIINGNDIVPVYPYEFEVLPLASSIKLKASTVDPFASPKNYIFQLDTSDKFLNPIATTTLTAAPGGVVEWNAPLLSAGTSDSIVYYWRVSRDSVSPQLGFNWRESSFQIIDNKYGWSQAHFDQFKRNRYQFIDYKKQNRLFEFANNINTLNVHQGFYPFWGGSVQPVDLIFNYNSSFEKAASRSDNGWTFFVIDSTTALFDSNKVTGNTYKFGTSNSCLCGDITFYDFGSNGPLNIAFASNTTSIGDSIVSFLNSIPANKWLLGYSNNFWRGVLNNGYGNGPQFSNQFYAALDSFGVPGTSVLMNMIDTQAVVFLGRRGLAPGAAHVEIGANKKSVIDFTDSIKAHWNRGFITSPLIGPAHNWQSLHWRYSSLEANSKDSINITVYGVTATGTSNPLITLNSSTTDLNNLGNFVNAQTYPFLRLVAELGDDSLRTAPQLNRWHVIYDPAAEGALVPAEGYSIVSDSLQEGDSIRIVMPFKNISDFMFRDSMLFTYWMEDNANIPNPLQDKLATDSLMPNQVIFDTIRISSLGFPGNIALWVDVNAPGHPRYQLEKERFNNIARMPIHVKKDLTNPILDVTFDGVHIMNRDIVSSKPEILITLKDENQFLAINDTADFEVYLKKPGSNTETRIWFCPGCNTNFSNIVMQFEPAQLPNNSCKIIYKPGLVMDGTYTLRVRAKDRSSNQSGSNDYQIQFEVINRSTITQVMNYPNPFSTSTRFVFTLTGSEIPETFMIQIMTVSGKVVREIKREELGYIHIGRNITEYSWDGTDEFGDRLANGVYLYRVVTRINGETIENKKSGADDYFTKELGKMVIIR